MLDQVLEIRPLHIGTFGTTSMMISGNKNGNDPSSGYVSVFVW